MHAKENAHGRAKPGIGGDIVFLYGGYCVQREREEKKEN